jgi:competence ComEA-like helix-hairpin-helix protein
MKNKKIVFLFLSFLLLVPLNVFPVSLSSLEINRTFHLLKNKIVDLHLSNFTYQKKYSPEEEAIIVLTKKAIFSELININFKKLPREFIVNALLKSGIHVTSMFGGPLEVLKGELLSYSIEQIVNWLLKEDISIAGGEISFSYQDINKERKTENLLYSIVREKNDHISITIYSGKHISPPLSIPGPAISNSLWRMNQLKEETLRPFTITFRGKLKETSQGALYFENNPEIEIVLYEETFPISLSSSSFFEKIETTVSNLFKNTFSSFLSLENVLKSSITAMFGKKETRKTPISTAINLDNIEREEKKEEGEEEKEEKEEKEEEKEKIISLVIEKENIVPSKIEINSALGEELETFVGIGPIYAERIIENRPYCTLDELTKVPGIGEVTLQKIKEQGLGYVDPPSSCIKEIKEETKEETKEEDLVAALLIIKDFLEDIKRSSEKEETKEENIDNNEEIVDKVEINSASLELLTLLVGIGPSLAERIIENRPYCTLDELTKVPGIGEVTLQKIKEQGLGYVDPPSSCSQETRKPLPPSPSPPEEKKEELEKIEINSASSEELQHIVGIGPSLAERIIENRPYCTLDELTKVPGIGEVTLQKIKEQGLGYVVPDKSCAEEKKEKEDKDSDKKEEEESIEFNIIIANAEIHHHLVLLQETMGSEESKKEVFEKTIVDKAEILKELILEKNLTIGLVKPSFIN